MEVSINPKISCKPIIEVKKFLCGEFFLPKKAPLKLKPEQINFAEQQEGGSKTVIQLRLNTSTKLRTNQLDVVN